MSMLGKRSGRTVLSSNSIEATYLRGCSRFKSLDLQSSFMNATVEIIINIGLHLPKLAHFWPTVYNCLFDDKDASITSRGKIMQHGFACNGLEKCIYHDINECIKKCKQLCNTLWKSLGLTCIRLKTYLLSYKKQPYSKLTHTIRPLIKRTLS